MSVFYKVSVSVDGRNVESVVKEGVLATVETGKHVEKSKTPANKIWILAGQRGDGAVAWVQVATIRGDGGLSITHEGWVGGDRDELDPVSKGTRQRPA